MALSIKSASLTRRWSGSTYYIKIVLTASKGGFGYSVYKGNSTSPSDAIQGYANGYSSSQSVTIGEFSDSVDRAYYTVKITETTASNPASDTKLLSTGASITSVDFKQGTANNGKSIDCVAKFNNITSGMTIKFSVLNVDSKSHTFTSSDGTTPEKTLTVNLSDWGTYSCSLTLSKSNGAQIDIETDSVSVTGTSWSIVYSSRNPVTISNANHTVTLELRKNRFGFAAVKFENSGYATFMTMSSGIPVIKGWLTSGDDTAPTEDELLSHINASGNPTSGLTNYNPYTGLNPGDSVDPNFCFSYYVTAGRLYWVWYRYNDYSTNQVNDVRLRVFYPRNPVSLTAASYYIQSASQTLYDSSKLLANGLWRYRLSFEDACIARIQTSGGNSQMTLKAWLCEVSGDDYLSTDSWYTNTQDVGNGSYPTATVLVSDTDGGQIDMSYSVQTDTDYDLYVWDSGLTVFRATRALSIEVTTSVGSAVTPASLEVTSKPHNALILSVNMGTSGANATNVEVRYYPNWEGVSAAQTKTANVSNGTAIVSLDDLIAGMTYHIDVKGYNYAHSSDYVCGSLATTSPPQPVFYETPNVDRDTLTLGVRVPSGSLDGDYTGIKVWLYKNGTSIKEETYPLDSNNNQHDSGTISVSNLGVGDYVFEAKTYLVANGQTIWCHDSSGGDYTLRYTFSISVTRPEQFHWPVALVASAETTDISYTVWNDFVDNIKAVIENAGYGTATLPNTNEFGGAKGYQFSDALPCAKMTYTNRALSTTYFNICEYIIDYVSSTVNSVSTNIGSKAAYVPVSVVELKTLETLLNDIP